MTKRCVAIGVVLLAACSREGSLGNYLESSSTAADAGASSDGTSTAVGDTSSDTGPVVCAQPGNCVEHSPCEAENLCGTLDSLFDAHGCVRQECQDDDACAADERCYRAQDFGGCAPSGVFCEDDPELQTCLCGSNPECGGGFCVPASLIPSATPLPGGVSFATGMCGPTDAVLLYLQWGGFGECDLDERSFALLLPGTLGPGAFELDASSDGALGWYSVSDGTEAEVLTASGEITSLDSDMVSGSVAATLAVNAEGVQIIAGDFELPICGDPPQCG